MNTYMKRGILKMFAGLRSNEKKSSFPHICYRNLDLKFFTLRNKTTFITLKWEDTWTHISKQECKYTVIISMSCYSGNMDSCAQKNPKNFNCARSHAERVRIKVQKTFHKMHCLFTNSLCMNYLWALNFSGFLYSSPILEL